MLAATAGIVVLTLVVRIAIAIANGFLPHDFLAYDGAVRHLLAGEPLYDTTATATGKLGLFLYPPSFALLLLPVALVPTELASSIWVYLVIVAAVAAIWVLPVSWTIRWVLTIAMGLSAPLVGAIAQGQVGPLLFLLLALAWRYLDRPGVVGAALALGMTIKIQPVILVAWAIGTGRRRAAAIAIAGAAAVALVATAFVGPGAWADLVSVLARTNQPILTPNSVGIGRLAFEAGASETISTFLYAANIGLVAVAFVVAIRRASPVASFLVGAVASQMISPVIWEHYAVVLFLPVAWLLSRGRRWAILILVATSVPISTVVPHAIYPIAFWVALLATLAEGMTAADAAPATEPPFPELAAS